MKKPRGQRFNIIRGRYMRTAPRKLRQVVDLIRHERVSEALDVLRFSPKGCSKDVAKLLESGVSNIMAHAHDWDVDQLVVAEAYVGKSVVMKRFRARARGRGARIEKKISNMTIIVREAEEA